MIDKLLMTAIPSKHRHYLILAGFSLPTALLATCQALMLAYTIDAVYLKSASLSTVKVPLLLLLAIFIARPLLQGLFEWHNRRGASRAKLNLRRRLTDILADNDQRLETENTTGYFATLACDGIESTDAYYAEFVPQLFVMAVNTVVLLLVAFRFDWISALIMAVTAPLIPLFMILIGKTAEGVNQRQWQSLKWMNGHLLDLLRGMTTLHYFEKHRQQQEAVLRTSESFRQKTMAVLRLTFLSALALELTATLSTAVIAVSLGVRLLYGQMSFVAALSILLLTPEYYLPLRQLGLKYHAAMNAKAVSAQLKPIFEHMPALESFEAAEAPVASETAFALNQIHFGYSEAAPLFRNFSLTIPTGTSLAVTGVSGIGKTTLLRLLMGELEPGAGTLNLFGQPLSKLTKSQRYSLIAFVPQQPKVFEGSLLENLRFGNPTASLADVKALADLTGFSAVIDRLPLGLETQLGEGQQALSGGETQLLAITRACIRQTPILILDEPTSALDPLSEALITTALRRIASEKTLIIAAHRKASVQMCDREINLTSLRLEASEGGQAYA